MRAHRDPSRICRSRKEAFLSAGLARPIQPARTPSPLRPALQRIGFAGGGIIPTRASIQQNDPATSRRSPAVPPPRSWRKSERPRSVLWRRGAITRSRIDLRCLAIRPTGPPCRIPGAPTSTLGTAPRAAMTEQRVRLGRGSEANLVRLEVVKRGSVPPWRLRGRRGSTVAPDETAETLRSTQLGPRSIGAAVPPRLHGGGGS